MPRKTQGSRSNGTKGSNSGNSSSGSSNRSGGSNRSRNSSSRSSNSSNSNWGVMDMARERPIAAAATAVGAAAAGLFLWSRRAQISDQLSSLSDQIGEWTENMMSSDESGQWSEGDDTAGLTTGRTGMSETGGGNASLGANSGGAGMTSSASGRGRARQAPPVG
jgi:hypothetical protein